MTDTPQAKTIEQLAQLSKRVGIRKASKAISVLMQWATTMAKYDWRPITIEEFREDWRISQATAYRWLIDYRNAFAEDDLPNERVLIARAALVALDKPITPDEVAATAILLPAA